MQVLSKFMLDGKVCFNVDDDGLCYPLTERGLYEQGILEGLIDAGYKILDYHGNIISPDGVSIQDFATEECTASDSEIQAMYDIEEGALSEAEATSYFTRDTSFTCVEMKEPKVRIKTREEFISYLQKYRSAARLGLMDKDVQPINSFVAQEALFSLEELVENPEVIDYLRIVEERRRLKSYTAYETLVAFLQSEGVLGETYTVDDIRTAYLSWGICGIKASVLEMKTKFGVTARITDIDENETALDKTVGLTQELCLATKDGRIIYSGGEEDLSDIEEYELSPVYPSIIAAYEDMMRNTRNWETDYNVVKCLVKKPCSRVYMTLLSDTGCTFHAKVDCDYLVIQSTTANKFTAGYLKIRSTSGVYRPLEEFRSKDEYTKKCMAAAKVQDIVSARTIDTPVDNSFDLCLREGVAPMNVISYLSTRIAEDKKGILLPGARSTLNDGYHGIDYSGAAEMYRDGPDKKYINKYNPDNLEYDNLDTLIDIMINTRSQMESEGTYLQVSKDDVGFEAASIKTELIERPVERLEFARDCMDGFVSIDFFNEGKTLDGGTEVFQLANLLLRIIYTEEGTTDLSVEEVKLKLRDIESTGIINMNTLIKPRVNAYKGYLKDRAILNSRRATECSTAVYVTRVYRELSNAPIDEQRHYMFEGIVLDLFNKKHNPMVNVQNKIANSFIDALRTVPMDDMYKDALKLEAPSIALKIIFALALKQANVVEKDSTTTTVRIMEDAGGNDVYTIDVKIDNTVADAAADKNNYAVKWVSLYDWCDMEVTGGAFNLYCLNADIDPWYVKPKKGVRIPVYSFEVNWIRQNVYDTLPEDFRSSVVEQKARVRQFESQYNDMALIDEGDVMDYVNDTIVYDNDTIDQVLDIQVTETIRNYDQRFKLHKKAAATDGKFIYRMRLKSDSVYANYASRFNSNPMSGDEDEYEVINDKEKSNRWLRIVTPTLLSESIGNDKEISSLANRVSRFDISSQKYIDVMRWDELVIGNFKSYTVNTIIGDKLCCVSAKGQITRDLSTLTKEDADKLTEKGILYQLSAREYLIKTITYDYKLEIV